MQIEVIELSFLFLCCSCIHDVNANGYPDFQIVFAFIWQIWGLWWTKKLPKTSKDMTIPVHDLSFAHCRIHHWHSWHSNSPVHSAASSSANSFLFDSQRAICFIFFEWWCFWILWRRCVGFTGDLKGKGKGKIKGKLQEVLEGQMQIDSFILMDPEGYGCFQPAPMYHQWIQVWSLEQTCASICTVWTRTCIILNSSIFAKIRQVRPYMQLALIHAKARWSFPFVTDWGLKQLKEWTWIICVVVDWINIYVDK